MNEKLVAIDPKELTENPFRLIGDRWTLITAGSEESFNTMTASWGGFGVLWNKPVVYVFIRPQRHTLGFVQRESHFTLSFFGEEQRPALQLLGSRSGRDGDKVAERVYMDILYRAKRYVHIMTPYLILDSGMENALIYAAERGVDVHLILPGIPDKKSAFWLARTHYAALMAAGVKISEYTPGFVHAKVFVADDCEAVVGTINLDYRSLYHHFECAAYLHGTPCIADIERDFEDTLSRCSRVDQQLLRSRPLHQKLAGAALKALAPLM